MEDAATLRAVVQLALVPGVGPRTFRSLLDWFGSADAVLAAPTGRLRQVPGIGSELSRRISSARQEIDVDRELELCAAHGVDILTQSDPRYPRLLRELTDAPVVIFAAGALLPQDSLAIAIVGTRHATHYGLVSAERLAAGLARAGLTIVSGMARGIDAAAHRGAMIAGGRTVGVLGSGVLNIYPPEHMPLANQIRERGALLSEAPPLSHPMSGAFPQRNRVISGLSLGVIVVEAADRSGALISARHAMEQGREVFAVPGRIDSRMSRGCHRLLRDGAKLVEHVDDVLEELGPLVESTPGADGQNVRHPAELQLNEQEQQVLRSIETQPTNVDDVIVRSALPVHRVLATISALEMRRLVRRISGNCVVRI